jgi:ABC-2 type transport system permease protein
MRRGVMKNSITIALHEIKSISREGTFLLLLGAFTAMTLASTYMGWASQHTIKEVYAVAAQEMLQNGKAVPPSPFAGYPHLGIVKNMIIYIVLIGGLMSVCVGNAAGMRERKAGVTKLIFSRPVTKIDFLAGKILGISLTLTSVMLLATLISAVSSAILSEINLLDINHMLEFYGLSLLYLLGFAFLGFSFALINKDSTVALLIPLIIWIAVTFMLPELASALYPTGSLNPTLPIPPSYILQNPTLSAVRNVIYPFSVSEHYKSLSQEVLGLNAVGAEPVMTTNLGISDGAVVLCWMLLCGISSLIAVFSLDKSRSETG